MAERDAHIDYELITKYLAGETLPDEQQEVETWLNASEENRRSFAGLKMLWEHTGRIIPHEEADVDVDNGWSKFREITDTQNRSKTDEKPAPKTKSLFYYASRIAAVLVMGLGFYFAFRNITSTRETTTILSAAQETVIDTLKDGSIVSLNVRSQIIYPENFSGDLRSVSLKGEAFFEVEPNSEKPFVIEANGMTVTVLGTSFYVSAYDTLEEIKVGVAEGRVQIKTENSDQLTILEKGESLSFNKNSNEVTAQSYEPNEIFWKSKTLIFQSKRLSEVFNTLEKFYNVNIEVENEQILDCSLTAKFYDEDIENIFDIISTNFNLTSTHESDHFLISGSGCD